MKSRIVFKQRTVGPSAWWLIAHGKKLGQPGRSLKDEIDLDRALPREHYGPMLGCKVAFIHDLEPSTLERQKLVHERIVNEGFPDVVNLRAFVACRRIGNESYPRQVERPRSEINPEPAWTLPDGVKLGLDDRAGVPDSPAEYL